MIFMRSPNPNVLTIIVDNEPIQLSHAHAERVADHLWEGLERGAVTAAARLTTALSDKGGVEFPLEFPAYETLAVNDALDTVGVTRN